MPSSSIATQLTFGDVIADLSETYPKPKATMQETETSETAATSGQILRPTTKYFLRYAGPGHTAEDRKKAPEGSKRAEWLEALYWRERTEKWLHASSGDEWTNAEAYGGTADNLAEYQQMRARYERIQDELRAQANLPRYEWADGEKCVHRLPQTVVITPQTVAWYWDNHGLIEFDGVLYRPLMPLDEVPGWVLNTSLWWFVRIPPYPPLGDEDAARVAEATPIHETPAVNPFATSLFADVPSDKYARSLVRSMRAKDFMLSESGYPVAVVHEKGIDTTLRVGEMSHVIKAAQEFIDDDAAAERALTRTEKEMYWQVSQVIGDREADHIRLALAIYETVSPELRNPDGSICVPIDIFLDARGVVRLGDEHSSWHRGEDRNLVADVFRRLSRLRVDFRDKTTLGKSIRESAVMSVDIIKTATEMTATHVIYRPGAWRRETAEIVKTPQNAWTCQFLFRADPIQENWEKRVGEYCTEVLRINSAAREERTIGDVLNATEIIKVHDNYRPRDTRNRLEKALNWNKCPDAAHPEISVIDDWGYCDPAALLALPKYKWFNRWTKLKVWFTAPKVVADEHTERAQKEAIHRAREAQASGRRKRGRPRKQQKG